MISSKAKSWIVRGCLTTAILLLAGGACLVYREVSLADHGERALHATLLVLDVVDKYVQTEGKWPATWNDLRRIEQSGGIYSWPKDSAQVREFVSIDFTVNPATIVEKGAERFEAIQPIGPCYRYTDYSGVAALIKTVQTRILEKSRQTHPGAT